MIIPGINVHVSPKYEISMINAVTGTTQMMSMVTMTMMTMMMTTMTHDGQIMIA